MCGEKKINKYSILFYSILSSNSPPSSYLFFSLTPTNVLSVRHLTVQCTRTFFLSQSFPHSDFHILLSLPLPFPLVCTLTWSSLLISFLLILLSFIFLFLSLYINLIFFLFSIFRSTYVLSYLCGHALFIPGRDSITRIF